MMMTSGWVARRALKPEALNNFDLIRHNRIESGQAEESSKSVDYKSHDNETNIIECFENFSPFKNNNRH